MSHEQADRYLRDWQERMTLAQATARMVGSMYRERGVVTQIYGRPIVNRSATEILRTHRYVRKCEGNELSIRDSIPLLEELAKLDLWHLRVDLGRLAMRWVAGGRERDPSSFIRDELEEAIGKRPSFEPRDVVLFGFGRIGRLVARLLIETTGSGETLRLRAIVVRPSGPGDLHKRASLLRRDSVHGQFNGTIDVDEDNQAIIANGIFVKVIYADSPDAVDYAEHGISDAIVVDNTGKWRDEEGLGRHLSAKGVAKVLLTAPGKGSMKNIVYSVNHGDIEPDDRLISAASCTTNAITPVLKAIHDRYGIESGHVETVHSYTNDQNLIDNFHKKERRGRSAPLNMVITETGAAKAVAKAVPELAGKLTANAIRVPTPNVSMGILHLYLDEEVTAEALNEHLRYVATHSPMHMAVDYSASSEIASTDVVGSRFAGVVDSRATIASGRRVVIYVWYDNEFGYSAQLIRVLQKMAGIEYLELPR